MENYDLRHCFVPDLSGLHVRIYQFRELLRQHLPTLSAHLDDLQVEPAYVSQWFLSFFAVTCPLPLLFRIYDVIFAEGASETIMRVALTLMRKNLARILACAELEDVMQLLLSRKVWDVYNLNADEFVQDFVNLSDVVTRERMAALEQGFRETKLTSGTNARSTDAAQISDVTTAASRFLGRLWATSSTPKLASLAQAATFGATSSSSSSSSAATNTLSPGLSAPSRPLSMLRRSTSKQSLASTLNSMDAAASAPSSSAASVLSSSTDATTISRDSAPDSTRESSKTTAASFSGAGHGAKDDTKYLHSQIEDLLTALNELQRSNALLASQLQKEREEREEDKKAVRALVEGLRDGTGKEALATSTSSDETTGENKSLSAPTTTLGEAADRPRPTTEQVAELIDAVDARFGASDDSRRSSIPQTRSQLQDDLARAKEQLSHELTKTQAGNRRIYELEQEMATYKEQLRESHAYVRTLHADKQRIEKQMNGLRVRSDTPSSGADTGNWFTQATGAIGAAAAATPGAAVPAPKGGLRELKLGRSRSTPSQVPQYNKRASSMMSRESVLGMTAPSAPPAAAAAPPPSNQHDEEHDAILMELAQAKTAEAIARQEAEEAKQKLETLRKALGLAPGETPPANNTVAATAATGASAAASAAMGMIGRLTGSTSPPASEAAVKASPVKAPAPTPAAAASGTAAAGGFWGWRR